MNRKRSRKSKACPQTRLEDFIRDGEGWALDAAYRLAGNREEARELVQESLFRVVRAWDTFDGSRPLEAWFLTILRNLFYDTRKASSRKALSLDGGYENEEGDSLNLHEVVPAQERSAFDILATAESQAAVRRALRQLSKKHRKALTACDMNGMRYREAAARLGVPSGTLRSRLSRARSAFRTAYRE